MSSPPPAAPPYIRAGGHFCPRRNPPRHNPPHIRRDIRHWTRTALLGLALLTLSALFTGTAHAASTWVPLDHPSYRHLESWATRGIIPPGLQGSRPITWQRLAGVLARARPTTATDRAALARLKQAVRRQLNPAPVNTDLRLTTAWVRGDPLAIRDLPAGDGAPLVQHVGGRRYGRPFAGEAELRLTAHPDPNVALSFTPRLTFGGGGGGNPGWQEGYLVTTWGRLQTSIGRQEIQWGPGRNGGLLISANAAPLPAVRFTLQQPLSGARERRFFPGLFDIELFVARLEANRVVPRPILSGMRLQWRPFPPLEVGLSRTTLFGGRGHSTSFTDAITIFTGQNIRDNDTSNSIAGFDLSLHVPTPGGRTLAVYGEYAGEDESNVLPIKPAVRGGLYLPGLGRNGRLDMRAEFTATDVLYTRLPGTPGVWYRHSVYQSGHTFRGRILGAPLGTDARHAQTWIGWDGARGRTEWGLSWLIAGFSRTDPETRYGTTLRHDGHVGDAIHYQVAVGIERVIAQGPGNDNWRGHLRLTLRRALTAASPTR